MLVLVLNCGSSSVKYAVVDPASGARPAEGLAERLGSPEARLAPKGGQATALPGAGHAEALRAIIALLQMSGQGVDAVGHRVVHGGERFTSAMRLDHEVIAGIEACSHLAPLHNPPNLAGIAAARAVFPDLPQVAVFDTAFHQGMPPRAWRYAVEDALYREYGVRRYGFHGTSHRIVAERAAGLLGKPLRELRLVTAHLGNGCSACAIRDGRSVDTTMGLTPLEGLVMGTRSGDVDPGLIGFLAARLDSDAAGITDRLNRRSGLLGLSGLSNDMRTLRQAADDGHAGARLAIEVFVYRLAKSVAALMVAAGGLDALVFTGGIGENDAQIRAAVIDLLTFTGLRVDAVANAAAIRGRGGRISSNPGAAALVVPTDEELQIARDTACVLAPTA
jgi:acetate kinase